MSGTLVDPNFWIPAFGYAFLFSAVAGLVIGTFELAFNRMSTNLFMRMVLHIVSIPIGAFLLKLRLSQNIFLGGTVHSITKEMFSLAGIAVGSFGIIIGTVELGFVPSSSYLVNRLLLYALALVVGILLK